MKKKLSETDYIIKHIVGHVFNCSSFDKIMDAEKVEPLQAEIRIEIELGRIRFSERVIDRSHELFGIRVEEFSGLSVL